MRIIARSTLREFWRRHKRAKAPLEGWYRVVRQAVWKNFADVRRTFRAADTYAKGSFTYVIFDIGGNKYRLIAKIEYRLELLYVGMVLTHEEYDNGRWKDMLPG
jgi:mRNA interferase HigB